MSWKLWIGLSLLTAMPCSCGAETNAVERSIRSFGLSISPRSILSGRAGRNTGAYNRRAAIGHVSEHAPLLLVDDDDLPAEHLLHVLHQPAGQSNWYSRLPDNRPPIGLAWPIFAQPRLLKRNCKPKPRGMCAYFLVLHASTPPRGRPGASLARDCNTPSFFAEQI